MSLVLVNLGASALLVALRDGPFVPFRVGLYQNDWAPVRASTISEVVPCTFSGYDGLRTITGWGSPTLEGTREVIRADSQVWTHDGGSVGNWVIGYYVVDLSGRLMWAERRQEGSVSIVGAGQTVGVVPTFSLRSQFPHRE